MGVVLLDGTAVRNFVMDEEAFGSAVEAQFEELDVNKDGTLSTSELRVALERLNLLETVGGAPVSMPPEQLNAIYASAFDMFDMDHNGRVDRQEFREQLRQILLAVADGLGAAPVQMVLDEGSLLQGAAAKEEAAAAAAAATTPSAAPAAAAASSVSTA